MHPLAVVVALLLALVPAKLYVRPDQPVNIRFVQAQPSDALTKVVNAIGAIEAASIPDTFSASRRTTWSIKPVRRNFRSTRLTARRSIRPWCMMKIFPKAWWTSRRFIRRSRSRGPGFWYGNPPSRW